MSVFLVVVHVIVCISLIMIVLLQTGKGADMGSAFGGGSSQTLFGSTGASTFLSKMTTVAAIVFMLTSLSLSYLTADTKPKKSIMSDVVTEAPVSEETPAMAPDAAVPQAADTSDVHADPAPPVGKSDNPGE